MAMFSVPVLLSSWAGFFGANWFDLVILRWYVPMSGIGVYSLATQLAGVVQQITIIFSTLVLPSLSIMVAERQDARIKAFIERLLPYWLLGTSVLAVLVLLGARVAIPFAFGPAFADAAPILALLMVATSALAIFNSCAPLVVAHGSMWHLTGVCLLSAAANVVLDLLLIPRFGAMGSAVATVLAYAISALLALVLVQKELGGRVLRLGWLCTPVLMACASFMLLGGAWFYVVAPIVASLACLALIAAFRLFRDDDAVFLKDLRLPMPFGARAS